MIDAYQKATYWPPDKPGGWGGMAYKSPQEILVRWQDKQQLIRAKDGREVVSQAVIYTKDRVQLEGRLCLGVSTEQKPNSVMDDSDRPATFEPLAVSSMVELDGTIVGYKVWV